MKILCFGVNSSHGNWYKAYDTSEIYDKKILKIEQNDNLKKITFSFNVSLI